MKLETTTIRKCKNCDHIVIPNMGEVGDPMTWVHLSLRDTEEISFNCETECLEEGCDCVDPVGGEPWRKSSIETSTEIQS